MIQHINNSTVNWYIAYYTMLIISPYGIAMPKGSYFTIVVFFLSYFFRRLIYEVTERIYTKLGNMFTYDSHLKNLVWTPPGIDPHGLGRTDFELWPNISLQQNMISTIGKKTCKSTGTPLNAPKFGKLWLRNSWERLASFCPPPKFSQWETLPALSHECNITVSRQTLVCVM